MVEAPDREAQFGGCSFQLTGKDGAGALFPGAGFDFGAEGGQARRPR